MGTALAEPPLSGHDGAVRSVFDQYIQPENRLTHALSCALYYDRGLLVPFLRWLGIDRIPPVSTLNIAQQTVPGVYDSEEDDRRGLPDMVVFDSDGWGVVFESKVQSSLTNDQLLRHAKTAEKSGYTGATVVALTVDTPKTPLPNGALHRHWRDVYSWFNLRAGESFMAAQFVNYLRAFEREAVARKYEIRGTITMFDGLRFGEDLPYTYAEAKRLIRLLGDEVQGRDDLQRLGVDSTGQRRGAITGKKGDAVWDYLPLRAARDAGSFTDYPHLTISIDRLGAIASVTVPNGVKGGFRTSIRAHGVEPFCQTLCRIEQAMIPVVQRCRNATPFMYVTQRHYKTQRSEATVDARMEADLRTLVPGGRDGVKHQPEWAHAVYTLLTQKRSNIQLGVGMRFDYRCPEVRSAACADLFAESWIACKPLLDLATGSSEH